MLLTEDMKVSCATITTYTKNLHSRSLLSTTSNSIKSVPKYIAEWNEGMVFSGNTELNPLWAAILGLSD